ncbi:RNA polymerase sigma factor (sigma-70 family) [Catalinimonas alkaloidigena]|uniref:RNA polymerase sigma factor n=1 Tax=Catalinimonas alkaloidigena TaxID=1075417 RepID=UPI002404F15C|nr:sigma-70 family RNA polymerase sigma factor [Catalinimonas alkaloidigena]MDF9798860.1 RNA polymerase sigma factor (sigma-70 family) [Catalinimonas alkaloidigena]
MDNSLQNRSSRKSEHTEGALLWVKMKEGNDHAFTHIYNLYFDDLCRYGKRITDDKELVEDSLQDLFVEIWKSRRDLPTLHTVKYYLYKRLKRKIIKKLVDQRKASLEFNVLEKYNFTIVFSKESELISQQFSEYQQRKLLNALNSLTRRQKEAITLRFYDGLTNQEVAGLLSMDIRSVRNLIYRAMLTIKKEMIKFALLLCALIIS